MTYVVLDLETTGLDYLNDHIIEIAAMKLDDGFNEVGSYNTFVKLPYGVKIPAFIKQLTGITADHLEEGVSLQTAIRALKDFIGDATIVAQYAPFDLAWLAQHDIVPDRYVCTKSLTATVEPNESSSLGATCERLGIELKDAHRAIADVKATAAVLKHRKTVDKLKDENFITVTPGRALQYIPPATEFIYAKGGDILVDYSLMKKAKKQNVLTLGNHTHTLDYSGHRITGVLR
jgi:DNA polymerase III subunit epsilon